MPVAATGRGGTATTGTGSSMSHVLTGDVPAGAWAVVAVGLWSTNNRSATAVSVGATGLTKLSTLANTGGYHLSLWGAYSAAGIAGTPTASVTLDGAMSDGGMVSAAYLSSVPTSSATDGTTGVIRVAAANTTQAWSSGTIATSNANDGLFGVAFADGVAAAGNVNTPTGSYTDVVDLSFLANNWGLITVFKAVTSTGSYDASGSWDRDPDFGDAALVVAFKEDAGATPADLTGTTAGVGSATGTFAANIPAAVTAGTGSATGALSAGVTHMGAGTAATAASGDVTASYPAGLALITNDVLICLASSRDNVSLTFPGGWTKKAEANNGTGLRQTIAWKRRAGGDSDVNVAVTHTAGAQIIAKVHVIRGAVTSGDPFEAATGPTAVSAASTGTFPSVTTLTAGDLLFYAFAYQDDYSTAPSVTNAQGLTLTERGLTEVS